MSGKLLRFTGSEHDEAIRMLPWLVNGSLDAREDAFVSAHLQACAHCRNERDLLNALREACRAPGADRVPPPAFARLRTRVEAGGRVPQPSGVRARLNAARAGWVRAPTWLRTAACLQAALLIAVATAWSMRVPVLAERPAAYRTLGSDASVAVPTPGKTRFLLMLAPDVSQGRTRQLLHAHGARIVDGPSDAGAYMVEVDAVDAGAMHRTLSEADGVVLLEALGAGGPG